MYLLSSTPVNPILWMNPPLPPKKKQHDGIQKKPSVFLMWSYGGGVMVFVFVFHFSIFTLTGKSLSKIGRRGRFQMSETNLWTPAWFFGGFFVWSILSSWKWTYILKCFFKSNMDNNSEKITGNSYNPPWSLNKALFLWEEVGTGGVSVDLYDFQTSFAGKWWRRRNTLGRRGLPRG